MIFTRKQRAQFAALRDAVQEAIAAPVSDSAQADVIDQLRRLGELRDSGVITQAEFEAKKASLLGQI